MIRLTSKRIKEGLAWRAKRIVRSIRRQTPEKFLWQWQLWRRSREFKTDHNYNLGLVDKGFLDRSEATTDDTQLLERIITAYNKAKVVQEGMGPSFKPSNEWLPIYQHKLASIMRVLKEGSTCELGRIYRNFFRDPCSAGLHGLPINMNEYFFGNRISRWSKMYLLNDAIHRYRLWKSMLGRAADIRRLSVPNIGNPYGVYFDGTLVNCGFYQHYYATLIARLTKGREKRAILELGGGYGGMAYFLIRDDPKLTYIDFDLPENMALTAYYLLKAFPSRRALLFGESVLSLATLEEYSIIVMPSFAITQLPDKSVDLAYNSYSLAEMAPDTIRTFVSEFTRLARRYILHVNHNQVSQVVADDFGIDADGGFELLYKIPALWSLGINPQGDEYEYLYQATGT